MASLSNNELSITIRALDNASKTLKQVQGELVGLGDTTESSNDRSGRSWVVMGTVVGAVAGAVQAATYKIITGLESLVGSAVKRVDTLNNANAVFADMGFSAADTAQTMGDLDKSIRGLPTTLDSAVTNVQLLAVTTRDLGKSQRIFTALNDAILGTGGSSEQVQNSVVQLSQAFSDGTIDSSTWYSLIQSMGPALGGLASGMGLTIGQLKDGLSNGTISVQQFQDALITMDTQGGGGMKSFRDMAIDATSGIGSGFTNAKTAVTRGLADIIKAIGSENISNAISKTGRALERLLGKTGEVVGGFKDLRKGFNEGSGTLTGFEGKMASLGESFRRVWDVVAGMFGPSLDALWHTVTDKLWPAIERFLPFLQFGAEIIGIVLVAAIWLAINALNLIGDVLGWLGQVVANVGQWFVDRWNNIVSVWGKAKDFFSNLGGDIGAIFSKVGDKIKDAFTGALEFVKSLPKKFVDLFAGVGGMIRDLIGDIDIPGPLGKIKDVIPGFATGTSFAPGGDAELAEDGPELVMKRGVYNLPRGSQVLNARQTADVLSQRSGSVTIHQTNNIYNQADLRKANFELGWRLATT